MEWVWPFGKKSAMKLIACGINGNNSKLAENRNDNFVIFGQSTIIIGEFHKKTQIGFYNINRASLIVFLSRYYNNETSYLFVNETELSNFQKSQPLNEQHIYTKNTAELKSFCT